MFLVLVNTLVELGIINGKGSIIVDGSQLLFVVRAVGHGAELGSKANLPYRIVNSNKAQ